MEYTETKIAFDRLSTRIADAAKDIDVIVSLLDCYHRDPMGNNCPWDTSRAQALSEGLQQLNSVVVILYVDDVPVGMATCLRSFSTWAAKHILNIHDFIIRPEYRGMGLGLYLMEHVFQLASILGMIRVTLEVRDDNAPALKLYEKAGLGPCSSPMSFWTKEITPLG